MKTTSNKLGIVAAAALATAVATPAEAAVTGFRIESNSFSTTFVPDARFGDNVVMEVTGLDIPEIGKFAITNLADPSYFSSIDTSGFDAIFVIAPGDLNYSVSSGSIRLTADSRMDTSSETNYWFEIRNGSVNPANFFGEWGGYNINDPQPDPNNPAVLEDFYMASKLLNGTQRVSVTSFGTGGFILLNELPEAWTTSVQTFHTAPVPVPAPLVPFALGAATIAALAARRRQATRVTL